MSVSNKKFDDSRARIVDFMCEYFVVCPRCKHCATVAVIDVAEMLLFSPRRLTCEHCGYTAEWRARSVLSRYNEEPRDWYFEQPFYYCTSCCGHKLWALNREHLDFLRTFVGAKLRSRSPNQHGWANRSLASRLPRWISAGKHRAEILTALEKIEQMMNKDNVAPCSRNQTYQKWVNEAMTGKLKPGSATRLRRIGAIARAAAK